jgi:hypothetical protein
VSDLAQGGCQETACHGEVGIQFGGLDMHQEEGDDSVWKRRGGNAVRGEGNELGSTDFKISDFESLTVDPPVSDSKSLTLKSVDLNPRETEGEKGRRRLGVDSRKQKRRRGDLAS